MSCIDPDARPYDEIAICQGPPRCDLVGDAAIAAINAGCPFCRRIRIDEDGNESEIAPGNA